MEEINKQKPKHTQQEQSNPDKSLGKSRKESLETRYDTLTEQQKEAALEKERQLYRQQRALRQKEAQLQKKKIYGDSSSSEDEGKMPMKKQNSIKEKKEIKEGPINPINAKPKPALDKAKVYLVSKKGSEFQEVALQMNEKLIIIDKAEYQLTKINKIKAFSQKLTVNAVPHLKIRFNYKDNEIVIAARQKINYKKLSQGYSIFASIINLKLTETGTKFRTYIAANIPGVSEEVLKGHHIYGRLLKKSKVLGQWQQRLVVINDEGLYSYKKYSDKKGEPSIDRYRIKELWTRFELEGELLVIKVLSGSSKTEFGLPINNFFSVENWLYHFYHLMVQVQQ